MTLDQTLLLISTMATVIGLIVATAQLNDEARARLVAWTRHAGRWLSIAFVIAAIAISVAGITLFGFAAGLPTRGDILGLLLHLFNLLFFIGLPLSVWAKRVRERDTVRRSSERG